MIVRLLALLCFILSVVPYAAKAENFDTHSFARLPVQHEGRIKPIDTFARVLLEHFSGGETVDGMNANEWLAETLFDPGTALQRPVFRIFRPQQFDLPQKDTRYYSFAELSPALQARADTIGKLTATPEKDWTEDQRALMQLSEASILYTQLLRSLSFLLPLNLDIPESLAKSWKLNPDGPYRLQDFRPHKDALERRVQGIIKRKGKDPARYSPEERAIAQFAMNLHVLEAAGQNNLLLRILPGIAGDEWHTPWALKETGQGSPQSAAYLRHWEDMARAYQTGDSSAWKAASESALRSIDTFEGVSSIGLEVAYNTFHPLIVCGFLYFSAFAAMMVFSLRANPTIRRLGLSALIAGSIVHLGAIVCRVLILERAPVGTLYESILFVALVCVFIAIVIECNRKDGLGLLTGAISGLLLLFTAGSFVDGDSMKVLVAVLNTNFWLSTHVLCITAGYGFCLIASLLAHLWLGREAFGRKADDLVAPVMIVSLVALLLTTVGTILGGIWADQSWGRFWGWDPKENGALLIVLWLVWLLHGRIAGQLKRPAFMAGIAMLSVIVALAWFGVNLLSVGLHSYGFITGVATGLGAFCALEAALIGYAWFRRHRTGTVTT